MPTKKTKQLGEALSGSEVEFFEALESLQEVCLIFPPGFPGMADLNEVRVALTQVIDASVQLQELCTEIQQSQKKIDEATRKVNLVRGFFTDSLNIICFNLSQISEKSIFQDSKEFQDLPQKLSLLEGRVRKIMSHNAAQVVPDFVPPPAPQGQDLEHIIDYMALAKQNQTSLDRRLRKFLIIDQDQEVAELTQRRLAHEGYEALTVSNPETAAKTLDDTDVIVIDTCAAEGEYADFINDVLKNQDMRYIPLIITGETDQLDQISNFLEKGVEDFLIKPYNSALLKARLRSSLDKKDAYIIRQERMNESQRMRKELQQEIMKLPDGFLSFDQNKTLFIYNEKVFEFFPYLRVFLTDNKLSSFMVEDWLRSLLEGGMIDFSAYNGADLIEAQNKWFFERLEALSTPTAVWKEHLVMGQVLQVTSYRTPDGTLILVFKDDTKNREAHDRLTFMAYHDALTGLPNRERFNTQLKQDLSQYGETGLAILFMDLDGFKKVNDSYGHDTGDWLLAQVGKRLRRCLRDGDLVARLGGDEFAAIIYDIPYGVELPFIIERILAVISTPFHYEGLALKISISIGIAFYPYDNQDFDTLLASADTAMYNAKQLGGGTFSFYKTGAQQGFVKAGRS